MEKSMILVINPGSTSTKIAVFKNKNKILEESIKHSEIDLSTYQRVADQFEFRRDIVKQVLWEQKIDLNELQAIAARGGLLKPMPGGTYLVTEAMCEELLNAANEHASNLGALIGYNLAKELGIPAYIVDPVVVDEMTPLAKLSGLKGYDRRSIWHPLNQKAVARKLASLLGKEYQEINCIIAHLGGGVTVGAHQNGKTVDVNNGLMGEGPYSPERTGGLPNEVLLKMVFEEGKSRSEIEKSLVGQGGCVSYLNTNDARVAEQMAETDGKARLIYEGMAYQISKEIASLAAVFHGQVDAIALTGGMAYSRMLTSWIKERVSFIAPVYLFPGEEEMEALCDGVERVLAGKEEARIYGSSWKKEVM